MLVNPASPRRLQQVYAAFDRLETARPLGEPGAAGALAITAEVADFLRICRNDLEAPAMTRAPVIAEILGLLRRPQGGA